MARKKASRKRSGRTEYWIFDRGILLRANGRPIILKNRKTAEQFVSEMGMDRDWEIKEGVVSLLETRGRKSKRDPGVGGALLTWAMMQPKKRPTHFDDQRSFMERFSGPLIGNPKQKRRAVRAFIKRIRILHDKAQSNSSIDKLLST